MSAKVLHRAAAGLALLLGFCMNPGCATIVGIETPLDTCNNGVKDKGEEGVDCGGVCIGGCAEAACAAPEDCASGHCDNGKCIESACNDKLLNGIETSPDVCPSGDSCVNTRCRPDTCFDSKLTTGESAIDCGGDHCGACNGTACKTGPDCSSEICASGTCQCGHCSELLMSGATKVNLAAQCNKGIATELFTCICIAPCGLACGCAATPSTYSSKACQTCIAQQCGDKVTKCQADK